MFRLTFLGTSSGIPTRERNTSALAIECMADIHAKRHGWLLVDCGEGTQHQLLKSHLSITNLSAILITHTHGDHCYGLGGLLASLAMHKRTKPLTIIAPKAIAKLLDTLTIVSELYFNYPIEFISIEDYLAQNLTISFGDNHHIDIYIHTLSHRISSFGFEIIQYLQKDKLLVDKLNHEKIPTIYWNQILKSDEVMIDNKKICANDYKVHLENKLKIVIAGDNDTPDLLAQAVQGAKALVHEATYTHDIMQRIIHKPMEQGGFDPKHSSAKMVAEFAQKHHIPMLILTHFSARYALFEDIASNLPNMGHVRAEAGRYYEGELVLAKDFLQVMIE
ncbi:ribonuclease Z [Moraxella oblonga]|uniref:ribonuclease Z n=1 Tax=Moraxella oblonga TaxID=200413 RepID=UPI0008309E1C|nr:ribonuclease Z [Moraxella oblonga]